MLTIGMLSTMLDQIKAYFLPTCSLHMNQPLVTAIVSTYSAERFMRGCLEDLIAQTLFDEIEVLVIDSGSPQDESAICLEYARKHPQIKLIRTEREPLYAAWNRAIPLARGKYLTNANTDDRHRSDSFEKLAAKLENSPEIVLAYGDQLTSTIENETFESCIVRNTRRYNLPDFSHNTLMLGCLTGSQPMWRRNIHSEHGVFDEKYRLAADYEFWMRISQSHSFFHLPEPLGVFFDSPNTLSGANNRFLLDKETLEIQLRYLEREPWHSDSTIRSLLAQTVFRTGYHYVEKLRDLEKARLFLREAWKLDALNFNLAKTYILRGVFGSRWRLE